MSDFEELYAVFIKTGPAKIAIQDYKKLHPEISAKDAASAGKNLAEIAYNLDMESYFNPEIKEGAISRNWNNVFLDLNRLPPAQLAALIPYSEIYADRVMLNAANSSEEAMLRAVFAHSAKAMALYAPDRMDKKNLSDLMVSVCEKITDPDNGLGMKEKYPLALSVFSNLYQGNSAAYFIRLGMINKALQGLDNPKNIGKVCEEIDNSYHNEGDITPVMAKGFEEYVIPMVNEIPDFNNMSAEHDCSYGEYGLIGYTNKVLTSQWTPKELNEAMGILKEVPTPDMLKREKLRSQAIQMENADFNGLRDLVHSETIGVSELVENMLGYYQAAKSGNREGVSETSRTIAAILKQNQSGDFLNDYLDLSRYERVIGEDTGLTAVEVLQDISDNMRKSNHSAPLVNDPDLDKMSQEFALEGYTNTDRFGAFMQVLNNKIIDNITAKKVGITPQMVDLLYWCDQKCANILKDRDFEQQCGDHKSDWFKQVALFAELTNSAETGFNHKGFEAYFANVQAQDHFFDANKILIKRQRNNIFKLFDASGKSQQLVEDQLRQRLQQGQRSPEEIDFETGKLAEIFDQRRRRMVSGNLVCEILKLNDFKKPSTRFGERYAEKMMHKFQVERPVEKTLLKMFRAKKAKGG